MSKLVYMDTLEALDPSAKIQTVIKNLRSIQSVDENLNSEISKLIVSFSDSESGDTLPLLCERNEGLFREIELLIEYCNMFVNSEASQDKLLKYLRSK